MATFIPITIHKKQNVCAILLTIFLKFTVLFNFTKKILFFLQEARERAARRTKNLQAYVDWFNRLSFLIATSVCQKKKKKLRVRVIEFWIEVARECVNIGNFFLFQKRKKGPKTQDCLSFLNLNSMIYDFNKNEY